MALAAIAAWRWGAALSLSLLLAALLAGCGFQLRGTADLPFETIYMPATNVAGIALDLKHPDGAAVLQKLITKADALVSNIRPAGLARLGFGYDICKELNPRLVYAVATGFGQNGPWAARPAFDDIIQGYLDPKKRR